MEIRDFIKKNQVVIDHYITKVLKDTRKLTPARREQIVRENENLTQLAKLEGVAL